jgi:hypothetical protein
MPALSDKVTAALQEVRILILGSEILLGFQFEAVFEAKFDALPAISRELDGLAYGLMLAAAILLLSPGAFHRLAESGADTARLHRLTTGMAATALLPFAACIGIDEYVVAEKIGGVSFALAGGGSLGAVTFIAWYGVGLARKRRTRQIPAEQIMRTPIKEKIRTLGTEIRVVLPGAQALLGFQFSAFLSDAFERLSSVAQAVHFASVTTMALAVVLLMAPAAFHRIATGGDDRREVDVFGSYAMLGAMFFLALSMAGDFYVVVRMVTRSETLAIAGPIAALIAAFALWFAVPLLARRRAVPRG